MNTLSYKTISVNKETAKKEWVVIDATDQVVGRLASKVAKLIRGKYKPTFWWSAFPDSCRAAQAQWWCGEVPPSRREGYAAKGSSGTQPAEQPLHLRGYRTSARGSEAKGN